MRRIFIPDDLEQRINEAKGSSFETFIEEACEERLWTDRLVFASIGEGGLDDLYVAVIESTDGTQTEEAVLMWRCHVPGVGIGMYPIMARDEEGMQAWTDMIALELNAGMDGPPVRWRRWSGMGIEKLEYLRPPALDDDDG